MRHTRSQTNSRRSHHKLTNPALAKDGQGNAYLRHRVSPATGDYRGRKVIDHSARLEKRAKKAAASHEHSHAH
ncbi:MAG: 50S ribosomal protein L32 [Candidatus Zambryskibacteria bacterium RIFCSPLOWO2_02_FULL_51_21]|uniref:Large ribosomal subunit protein bL32 n=1 Tax=Candidatus Zambryskibacteria bacterium RIFCSPHIGHO2_02_FULL_43_37 TaxID=1802749 RepID=A0A1G2THL5_9BACT|nr:MAG: 50S ribosomal protein L32 [Candidatus Zambryskibacteria bacterium RIFCSPHIGHO2_01_FULL_52_18]OHA96692.1 MAG: 50S ribosomal protein L32 [Candidatus Zambryskibacteria bacterium RIFCSPHIGHO2_02_FULL_43_37]OHB06715.1 MAG: 50S ribosomal protein L32 [Candidatus Zambryskibacteria bacterium RIFCSPLOWO2_01_FULL_52_12]OHB11048.1 MAG: 50S ribosomal protein L32 [Candidatus Zambryskibacteria bacterium RIFCSPLOWO2_02_FULL_51_21]